MTLHRGLIGQRVVVRRVVTGEVGPSGGPALTDVLGILEAWGDQTLSVRREAGDLVTVPLAEIVAGKGVPPRTPPLSRT
ncbi:MAG: hypothetical protein H0U51_04730 [Propionibacteriales bacterium]|nr:hypothetical protein [Propionibacteriales bacterium]